MYSIMVIGASERLNTDVAHNKGQAAECDSGKAAALESSEAAAHDSCRKAASDCCNTLEHSST